jgi:hypothetical protein
MVVVTILEHFSAIGASKVAFTPEDATYKVTNFAYVTQEPNFGDSCASPLANDTVSCKTKNQKRIHVQRSASMQRLTMTA